MTACRRCRALQRRGRRRGRAHLDGRSYSVRDAKGRQHGRRYRRLARAFGDHRRYQFLRSIIAFLKLQELMTGRPVTYPGQQIVNALLLSIAGLAVWFVASLGTMPAWAFGALLAAAPLLGDPFVLPIGGADMPVVISLLNSFTGLAVAITGFESTSRC